MPHGSWSRSPRSRLFSRYLICCNENFAGPAGLLKAMALEATDAYETIHTDTALGIVGNYIKRYGSFAPQAVCPSPAEPAEPAAEPAAGTRNASCVQLRLRLVTFFFLALARSFS